MFGMDLFHRSTPVKKSLRPQFEKQQNAPEETPSDESFMIVSVEDIYRAINGLNRGRPGDPVLLLKKGIEVQATQLPRLMKNGADPSQFRLKAADGTESFVSDPVVPMTNVMSMSSMTHPLFEAPASLVRALRSQKRVLILDPEQKSLKRLIDCLFMCGFQLDKLHPVRMASSLHWALHKYTPHVLVIDYRLSEKQNGIQILHNLQGVLPSLEQVILTTPPLQNLSSWEARRIESFCENWNVHLLPKPVSRFALKQILDQAICQSDINP